jgi:hypothetical protein
MSTFRCQSVTIWALVITDIFDCASDTLESKRFVIAHEPKMITAATTPK